MLTTVADLDVELALPDHWYEIPLEPDDRDRGIAQLVTRRISPDPATDPLRHAVTHQLRRAAGAACGEGALICASMSLAVDDAVVGAHLVVTLGDVETPAPPNTVVDLARIGPVSRVCEIHDVDIPGSARGITTLQVTYEVPIATEGMTRVRLAFSSPSVAYADPLVEMFDMIASSVRTFRRLPHQTR